MMESDKIKSFSSQLKGLLKVNKDLPQKLKQHLVSESSKVENPFKFIVELFNEGVLSDGSSDLEAHFGFKEMLVQLAVTLGCSKGADGIGGLVKALENSGNLELLTSLQTWVKEDLGIQSEDDGSSSEPEAGTSARQSPRRKNLRRNVTSSSDLSLSGAKLVIRIMSHMQDDGFMEQLEAHLLAMAPEIVHDTEFCTSLLHQNVLMESDVTRVTRQKTLGAPQVATGPKAKEGQQIEEAIKAACSKKAIGPLVVALENSNNERILIAAHDWLETFLTRRNNHPIAVQSLANQRKPTATGLFAATGEGLISVDLQTLEATALTSEHTLAVAVNQKLNKVYWAEGYENSRIMRSNFDGSGQEVIVPQQGKSIFTLAIDETSGNVYFAPFDSPEVIVCCALGENCTVISRSSLVHPIDIVVDSVKG